MDRILSKILNYESSIFEEYSSKRKDLINHIKNINLLNNDQLLIFIHDLKAIIDPIKTSSEAIDYYFTNENFKKNDNIKHFEEINKLMFFYLFLNFTGCPEDESEDNSEDDTLETEISESVSEISDSDSELSKSSRSVSDTFSNENSQL